MNRNKVLELAREARLAEPTHPFNPWGESDDALERFVALIEREVRVDEREACATICDHRKMATPEWQMDQHYNQACSHCAQAIRLRGSV